jgi:intein-encoded DNA endonuclease-like protein
LELSCRLLRTFFDKKDGVLKHRKTSAAKIDYSNEIKISAFCEKKVSKFDVFFTKWGNDEKADIFFCAV